MESGPFLLPLKMKAGFFAALAVLACLVSSCRGNDPDYYVLEGGDPAVDWIEFSSDSTIRWVGPGGKPECSPFEIDTSGTIVVHVAPFSTGRLHRLDGRTLRGEVPFFEGTWKKTRVRR